MIHKMEERKEKKKSRRIRRIRGWGKERGGRRKRAGVENGSLCICLKKLLAQRLAVERYYVRPLLHARLGLSQLSQRLCRSRAAAGPAGG